MDGFTVSKWNGSFPSSVASIKVVYLVEGTGIFLLVNPAKEADGVGVFFSPIPLLKN